MAFQCCPLPAVLCTQIVYHTPSTRADFNARTVRKYPQCLSLGCCLSIWRMWFLLWDSRSSVWWAMSEPCLAQFQGLGGSCFDCTSPQLLARSFRPKMHQSSDLVTVLEGPFILSKTLLGDARGLCALEARLPNQLKYLMHNQPLPVFPPCCGPSFLSSPLVSSIFFRSSHLALALRLPTPAVLPDLTLRLAC